MIQSPINNNFDCPWCNIKMTNLSLKNQTKDDYVCTDCSLFYYLSDNNKQLIFIFQDYIIFFDYIDQTFSLDKGLSTIITSKIFPFPNKQELISKIKLCIILQ